MPNVVVMSLDEDHTNGSDPGAPTPRAMVADNDLALGRIVERISDSRFWPTSLILVVEDDAQDGLDHVDGRRTIALAISPFVRRNVAGFESLQSSRRRPDKSRRFTESRRGQAS